MRSLILIAASGALTVASPQVQSRNQETPSHAVDATGFRPGPGFIFVPPIIAPADACSAPSLTRAKDRKKQHRPRRRQTIEPIIVHHRQDWSSS